MLKKICPKCAASFDASEFLSIKGGKKKPYCRECTRKDKRDRYDANPAPSKEAASRWAGDNPERYKENQAKYRKDNRQKLNAMAKVYRQNTVAKFRPYDAAKAARAHAKRVERAATDVEFALLLKTIRNKATRKHYNKHKDALLAKASAFRAANLEMMRERTRISLRKHYKKHPEKAKAEGRRRKALRRGAKLEGFDEMGHKSHLEQWQIGKCFHCNRILDENHVDHYVPIAKGGKHSDSNLVLSCPPCNLSKNDRIIGVGWNAPVVPESEYAFKDPDFSELCDGDIRFHLLSTFMVSERNRHDAACLLPKIKSIAPDSIIIFDHEWLNQTEAVTSFIQDKLGKSQRTGARKTELVEVDSVDAREFFDRYHLQGFGAGYLYLGLEKDGELVGCSAWAMKGQNIELNRMAFKGRVAGGFSKMMKGLLNHETYAGQPILSFVDPRYATGSSYEKVGFTCIGETSAPVYYYANSMGLYHRRSFMKQKMKGFLSFYDESLSERQNAKANGYYRVYGLKQRKYIYMP